MSTFVMAPTLLGEEIKLHSSTKEREEYDTMADLYAIIQTVEHLERAWIAGVAKPEEYTSACSKLISQFNVARGYVPEVSNFMKQFELECPRAVHRLLKIGVPATTEHAAPTEQNQPAQSAKHIADAVGLFMTLMNNVQLKLTSAEVLHPLLSDLVRAINRISTLPAKFEGKDKIRDWLITLNQMKPTDQLTEDQARQFLFDMEKANGEFYARLDNPSAEL